MNKYTELIDKYFSSDMGSAERSDFERQLEADPELKAEFDGQARVLKGIESFAIKSEIGKGLKRKALKIKAGRWLAAITIATLLALLALATRDESLTEENKVASAEPKTAPLEAEKNLLPRSLAESKNSAAGAQNEKPLSAGRASLHHEENEPGVSFVWSKAKGNNLPQSAAGPFADRKARPAKTKAVSPANPAEQAAVFGSKRQRDGHMSWKSLGARDQGRILADSLALEAYSRYLQDTVKNAELVVKDKKLADSLYRSFMQSAAGKEYLGKDTDGVVFLAIVKNPLKPATGAALFRKNCASCHSLDAKKIKGPGMEGVMSRVPGGDWLFNYILNSKRMISSGNAYANKIYEEHGRAAMKVFEGTLSETEIRSIIDFLAHLPAAEGPGSAGRTGPDK